MEGYHFKWKRTDSSLLCFDQLEDVQDVYILSSFLIHKSFFGWIGLGDSHLKSSQLVKSWSIKIIEETYAIFITAITRRGVTFRSGKKSYDWVRKDIIILWNTYIYRGILFIWSIFISSIYFATNSSTNR